VSWSCAGPRDADEGDGLEGVVVKSRRVWKELPRVGNKEGGGFSFATSQRFDSNSDGALLDRSLHKLVAVRMVSANGHKEVAGLDLARVISQGLDLQSRIAPEFRSATVLLRFGPVS